MLPRKKLIDLKHQFPKIRKEGKVYDTPLFGLIIAFSHESDVAKCAFVVSKKVSLKSVVRHDVKRKLSEAVEEYLPNINDNTDLLFLAKQPLVDASVEQIKKEIESVLRRVRILDTTKFQH